MTDKKLLQQAIKVLRDVNEKHYEDSSKKKPLLEDEKETTLYLQISLKKIPKTKLIQMIKVNLPHSLMKDNSEVCLIAGDLDKKDHKAEIETDVLHYKELLKKHGINNVSEVVTLRQLRTEYKPYEAKQKLLAAYDIFLADRKIAECLPKAVGRHFFKKRKFPIQITLNTPNLKQQVEKALSTKVFYVTGRGNSCTSEIAHLDMSDSEISENVAAVAKAFCDELPGSWNNVMGMYLKTALSKAIPVYMSYDDPNEVQLDEIKDDDSYEIDELSTHLNSLVKVYKDGSVRIARMKRMADTEIGEPASINTDSNIMKKNTNDDLCSLTDINNNDDSDKGKQKSKRIKIKKEIAEESTSDLENDKKNIKEEKEKTKDISKKSSRKKLAKSILIDQDEKTVACTGLEGKSNEMSLTSKNTKKNKGKKLMEEADAVSSPDLKMLDEDAKIHRKSMRKNKNNQISREEAGENGINSELTVLDEDAKIHRKSMSKNKNKQISRKEAGENGINSELTDKAAKEIGKPKNKRKREKSILSDANTSLTYSPVQVVKKIKTGESFKGSPSVKGNRKGKQKKRGGM